MRFPRKFRSRSVVTCSMAAVTITLTSTQSVFADTLHVPDDYPTIQEAIDAAAPSGDEIIVAPGTYHESISLRGKDLYLHSSDGYEVTTIDATGLSSTVILGASGELADTIIEGFTITGGEGIPDENDKRLGGGMLLVGTSPRVENCRFFVNDADEGGGIYTKFGNPFIAGCDFRSNYGAGIWCDSGNPIIYQCTFDRNDGFRQGGGIYTQARRTVIAECLFAANESQVVDDHAGGGAIYLDQLASNSRIQDCTFEGNRARNGGAIESHAPGVLIEDCRFVGNVAGDGQGGALNLQRDPVVQRCEFLYNTATGTGGAVYIIPSDEGKSQFLDCTFRRNASGNGGAVQISGSDGDLAVDRCLFEENAAAGRGGALSVSTLLNFTPVISNSIFRGNIAYGFDARGGGIAVSSNPVLIVNCLLEANESAGVGGGLYCFFGSQTLVRNTTIVDNYAAVDGSGVLVDDNGQVKSQFSNVLVHSNIGSDFVSQEEQHVRYSLIGGGYPGVGNIDAPPMFVDPSTGDYRLRPGSPCIDAGLNSIVPIDIESELDGLPRFVDSEFITDTGSGDTPIVDIGAYEFQATANPIVNVTPEPLVAGQPALIEVLDSRSGVNTFLAYSIAGLGRKFIAPLNVTLDIAAPRLVLPPKGSDTLGSTSWRFTVPPELAGTDVWLQAAQVHVKTSVTATRVD